MPKYVVGSCYDGNLKLEAIEAEDALTAIMSHSDVIEAEVEPGDIASDLNIQIDILRETYSTFVACMQIGE